MAGHKRPPVELLSHESRLNLIEDCTDILGMQRPDIKAKYLSGYFAAKDQSEAFYWLEGETPFTTKAMITRLWERKAREEAEVLQAMKPTQRRKAA